MMSVELVPGKYGTKAILSGEWTPSLASDLHSANIAELEINVAKGWRGHNIDFVRTFPQLQSLEVFSLGLKDVSAVHHLHSLKRLAVTTYCETPIDASQFPELESIALEWRPGCESVFACSTLRECFINRYSSKGTLPVERLPHLESLSILNSSIRSLHGLVPLKSLTRLRIAGLRTLSSLSGIDSLVKLVDLDISSCNKLTSITEVYNLRKLIRLMLNNCGSIESLRPILALHQLTTISFWESTTIADGDLSPLLALTSLKQVSFANRRHYSHTREQILADISRT